jgi:sialic acid synthase SpsE
MKTRLILETGCNHQGKVENVLDMMDQAIKLGVWGIKFQKRDIEQIPELVKKIPRDMSNSFGPTYYEHRRALEFDIRQIDEFKKYAEAKGIHFICSAFDINSLRQLKDIGCFNIKIPSQYLKNSYFYDFVTWNSNLKYFVSTGMHTRQEILNSPMLDKASVIMHCISKYPCQLNELSLDMINVLEKKYNTKSIGYSSHDKDGRGIRFAVIAGAKYIERHFTLDKAWKGADHSTVSSNYHDIKWIIKTIEQAEKILGKPERELTADEQKVRQTYIGY